MILLYFILMYSSQILYFKITTAFLYFLFHYFGLFIDLRQSANSKQIGYLIYKQMAATDERTNIMELPLPQRTVAVALKHIFDQIKAIDEEEAKQIQQIHSSFIKKFKQIQVKSSKIIKGGPITIEDLKQKDKFFKSEQNVKVEDLIKNHKVIEAYWFTVFMNYFGDHLTVQDKAIAVAITDMSTNFTEQKIELTIQLSDNQWIKANTITRSFILKQGIPVKIEGNKAEWLKSKPKQGILPLILKQTQVPEQIAQIFTIVGEIVNELIPYSLEFYLGAVDSDEEEQGQSQNEGEDDDQQEENDEQDEGPTKKVKE